jgi:hypothetical protein
MPNATQFRLNRNGLLLALISAAFAGQAHAAAGRIEFAFGGATVSGANGQSRPATRGVEVNSGDVVRTTDGRVQVRMADGAYISLQPNTEFGIKEYKFEGKADGTESAFYSLLKGAMRTVTGLIGRTNRNRYQVATPTATVGIRGTGGLIQVQNDGSTLVQGTSGIWFLANPSGSIDIPAGVSGVAPADPSQPPKETVDIPAAGPAPLPPEEDYVQGDQREPDGENVITLPTTPVLTSGSGYSVATAHRFFNYVFQGDGNATANFNSTGQLIDVSFSSETYKLNGGSHADFGTDGILAWGRWVGPVSVTSSALEGSTSMENYGPNEGLHYVIGMPTARLPVSGTATYVLLGATSPTFLDGSGTPGTFSFGAGGGLTVNFFGGGATLNLSNAQVTMPTHGTYVLNGGTTICGAGSSFSFSPAVTPGGGSACLSTCSSFVGGFFAGSNAERAGLAYHINDSGLKEVVGTAALTK